MRTISESPRRLRQKDLVATLFILFSEEYDRSGTDSITDISILMPDVRDFIRKKTGIAYSNDAWIITQIHKYEEELGTTLFRRAVLDGQPALGLCREIYTYEQKRHLYVTQKIRTANGAFDLMRNSLEGDFPEQSLHILLEAGSTVTRVAEIIAEHLPELPVSWNIHTNNLGVIECLGRTAPAFSKVILSVPKGRFNPATNLILGEFPELYGGTDLDWIIQGTSFLSGGQLYVEREDEARLKSRILHECRGRKVLILTGHEATAHPDTATEAFGSVKDYDYIIHPALLPESAAARRLKKELACPGNPQLSVMIRNWSYQILVPS
jgi:hypothetical protein